MSTGWIVCMAIWAVMMVVWVYLGPIKKEWATSLPFAVIALASALLSLTFIGG